MRLIVDSGSTKTDWIAIDDRPIRIRARMPGPISSGNNQGSSTNPGSNWSAVCGGNNISGTAESLENWYQGDQATFHRQSSTAVGGSSHYVAIDWNTNSYAVRRSDDVVIIEVRFKSTATGSNHKIKSIQILDVQ